MKAIGAYDEISPYSDLFPVFPFSNTVSIRLSLHPFFLSHSLTTLPTRQERHYCYGDVTQEQMVGLGVSYPTENSPYLSAIFSEFLLWNFNRYLFFADSLSDNESQFFPITSFIFILM